MKKQLFIVALITTQLIQAQWTQIGDSFYGETEGEMTGTSVSMNADGSIIAVGAPFNEDASLDAGEVRVYQRDSGSWIQMGEDIEGDPVWGYSGWSVSLSADGLTLAIGAPEAYDEDLYYAGQVRILHYNGTNWELIGDPIIGETQTDDHAGNAVSLSDDGSIIAIASYGIYSFTGRVRVFENVAGVWTQIGNSLDGEISFETFGESVSINGDGTILVVGAPNYSNGAEMGHVKVFQNLAGNWEQIGDTLEGDELGDRFGWTVSINSTGDRIAIGARFWGSYDGMVKVFQNNAGTWQQMGENILDDYIETMASKFGTSVSLNNQGDILAIGSTDGFNRKGYVCAYQYVSDEWVRVGGDMVGDSMFDSFGFSVCMNASGSKVIVGARGNDVNGNASGQVKVFQYANSSGINNLSIDKVSLFPNPVESSFTIYPLDQNINKITITDNTGKNIVNTSDPNEENTIDISGICNGNYIVRIQAGNKTIIKKIIKK